MSNQFQNLRKELYDWRQRRPLRRLFALTLLLFVWPPRWVIQRLLNLFSEGPKGQRILVIHLAGLGDTLMLTPALAALQKHFPKAKIDLITLHRYVQDAFQKHPRFNSITTLPAYPGDWIISQLSNRVGVRLLLTTLRCYPDLLLKHALVRYDLGINFGLSDFDQRLGNALLYCLDIPVRTGSRGVSEELLSQRVSVNCTGDHRVKAYLSFLNPLGVGTSNEAYEFPVNNSDSETVQMVLRDQNIDSSRPLAVIHPGGKLHINSRRWPAEYFARVGNYLSREGFEVVLTGDEDDRTVCDKIQCSFGSGAKSIAGRLNFSQTAALISDCDLFITNDSATLHLAEAVGVPRVVSIFGPTDASLLAPQNERHVVFRSNLPCAPCMGGLIDANTERCWRDVREECLWQTTPEEVIGVLRTIYEKPAARVARA